MYGIYIHIPYCLQPCFYCDFHFRANLNDKLDMLQAISTEILQRAIELKLSLGVDKIPVSTIYFGGGTPSVLAVNELENLLNLLQCHFQFPPDTEITIEANPDDLNPQYCRDLRSIGFNRVSVGIQSLDDEILRWMNRRHNASEALQSIDNLRRAGFDNINIDLIYGVPNLSSNRWQSILERALAIQPQHISAYHLTIENKTVFGVRQKRGEDFSTPESLSLEHFEILTSRLAQSGYEHYEISNFALPDYFSRHNYSYWTAQKYLGFGPSAHSFDGTSRRFNICRNDLYIKSLQNGSNYYDFEVLTPENIFNEYIMTRLRTRAGIDLDDMKARFSEHFIEYFLRSIRKHLQNGSLSQTASRYSLFPQSVLIADRIIEDLFFV